MSRRSLGTIGLAAALTLPWVVVWAATDVVPRFGVAAPSTLATLSTLATVAVSGVSILGAAFLLAWAAETAEKDVPRAFAIAVLAVLAVAPEYAVDALYAWNAGQFAGTERGIEAGNLAVANMTGANRILIGLGWSGIALFTIFRRKADIDPAVVNREGIMTDAITVDRDIGLEIVFLLIATLWAFLVPLSGGIDALDMLFLVGLYVAYIAIVLRGELEPSEMHTGVPAYLQSFSKPKRIGSVLLLFAYSGLVIFVAVEPFAHGLEEVGTNVGIPPFFMIQWIAPLASESPELIVVAYLVNKARSTAGFNALISSKLNQWTLLIGTLVLVYSLGLGQYGTLAFDQKQAGEIWITAAQSLFAVALLIDFEITAREAVALLVLFLSQVLLEFAMIRDLVALPIDEYQVLLVYTAVYVVLALALFVHRREQFRHLLGRTAGTVSSAVSGSDEPHGADD
ncbi:sodium:calcium antiporter [Halopiger goleimassiliensis]|uniref:sodium:calcium antiporter n=1 Tax=Halopiger goleimassiliensis TaxID=1293048 RepID=UPI000678286D|nr:sodium:calcium antiporter [Halopiger goleimassiliensis]